MKNVVRFVSTVLLAFVGVMAVGLVLLDVRNQHFDRDSRRYAEAVAPAILQQLDVETLLGYASPALRRAADPAQLEAMFTMLKGLGAYQGISDCAGQAYMEFGGDPDEVVTAFYEMAGHFDRGSVWVRMRLVHSHRQWQLLGFQVSASTFQRGTDPDGSQGA